MSRHRKVAPGIYAEYDRHGNHLGFAVREPTWVRAWCWNIVLPNGVEYRGERREDPDMHAVLSEPGQPIEDGVDRAIALYGRRSGYDTREWAFRILYDTFHGGMYALLPNGTSQNGDVDHLPARYHPAVMEYLKGQQV